MYNNVVNKKGDIDSNTYCSCGIRIYCDSIVRDR